MRGVDRSIAVCLFVLGQVFCSLVIGGMAFGPALAVAGQRPEPLILENADSSEVLIIGGKTEYHLLGNVIFQHGTTRLTSDRAIQREDIGEIRFIGAVEIHQPKRYLAADEVVYQREQRSFQALGSVHVEDTGQSFSIYAERVRFDREQGVARADSNPVMYWDFILDSADQTVVWADTIIFFTKLRHGIGIGSVRVRKGDWWSTGEYGEIWPDSGYAVISGDPRASGVAGEIAGDTLIMEFTGQSIHHLRAAGRATGSYRDSTETGTGVNLIKGRLADFYFRNDSLTAIRVIGEAYTDHQPDDPADGTNRASGDSLWLRFSDGQLSTVTIGGGAEGTYRAVRDDGGADTVRYQAEQIVFVPDSSRIDLTNSSRMTYGNIILDAGRVSYWTDTRNLLARPLPPPRDSTGAVKSGVRRDKLQPPHLADGQQLVVGDTLTYNIDSRRGRIRGSSTELEGGYYRGGDFRKYTDDMYFISDGIYTTCEYEPPHFRFESRDMEVIRDDKVIARPVVLRLGELPVAILPYYVFPIKRGRHSGFLPIRFGNFDRGNRYINNVGYYWAASDYWDLESALDFNEETGLNLRSTVNYALRYKLNGYVSGGYARQSRVSSTGRTRSTSWRLVGSHTQKLSPTATLSGNANFISDKTYFEDYQYDPNDRRQRTLRSQMNLTKNFAKATLTVAVEATDNLDTEVRTRFLPNATLSLRERRFLSPDSGGTARWYHNGYISLSARLKNYMQSSEPDTLGQADKTHYSTLDYTGRIRFPQRLFTHVTLSPSASFQETWYYVFDTRFARESGVPVNDPGRRLSGTVGISSNTNLYGFIHPGLFGLSTVRHTMTPSVSYSFTPAIKQNDELRAFTRAGGGSSRRTQALSFTLGNTFDAKLGKGDDERKISLFTSNFRASYNLEADERKWSNLSGTARTSLARRLGLSVDAVWDLYNPVTGDLQWTNPYLVNFGVNANMTLRGNASALTAATDIRSRPDDTTFTSSEVPFNVAFTYRYNENRASYGTTKSHQLTTRVDFEPTTNWSIAMNNTYDFARKRVTSQTFTLNRDLHCWSAQFVWRPGGSGQGYYFRIGVKDIPDIKIERSESGLRGPIGY